MKAKLNVGFAYNLATSGSTDPIQSECTNPATVNAITSALENADARVLHIDAGNEVDDTIKRRAGEIDVLFNYSIGTKEMESRRSHVSQIVDGLGIPYTGSTPEGHNAAMDKGHMRKILDGKVRQPRWYCHEDGSSVPSDIKYPVFIKPVAEGASQGIAQENVVYSDDDLLRIANAVIKETGKPVLVEEYLSGKEFDVAILGNFILPLMELDLQNVPDKPSVRDHDVKLMDYQYFVPISINGDQELDIAHQACSAYRFGGISGYSRVDMRARAGNDGASFLEINTMPSLDAEDSVFMLCANVAGIPFDDVINSIVYLAMKKFLGNPDFKQDFRYRRTGGFSDAIITINQMPYKGEIPIDGITYRLLDSHKR